MSAHGCEHVYVVNMYTYTHMPTGWIRGLSEMHGSEHYCYDANGLYAALICSVHVLEGM